MKIWIFDDLFNKKGPVLDILVPEMIQPSGPGGSLVKYGYQKFIISGFQKLL